MKRAVTDDDLERIRRFVDRPRREREPDMLRPDDSRGDEPETTASGPSERDQ